MVIEGEPPLPKGMEPPPPPPPLMRGNIAGVIRQALRSIPFFVVRFDRLTVTESDTNEPPTVEMELTLLPPGVDPEKEADR